MSNPLKIISWNVNGLRAAAKKGFLDWLRREDPDIVCLQEIKAESEQLPEELRSIPGYQSYFCSASRKGYSGVAIYSKTEPLSVLTQLGVERFDGEGRTLIAEYPRFTLLNCYFPNGKASAERLQYKLDFYDTFLDYANRLRNTGRSLIICGDVNTAHQPLDLARPKENEKTSGFLPEERAWLDRLVAEGYLDSFRLFHSEGEHYTWWDQKTRARERNVGWRIDYFWISADLRPAIQRGFILPEVTGSDHCPIGIELSFVA
jgi:exodeoxyribonuclease-3